MLMGTGSDVGKSLVLAGLGRAYARRGLSVRPFKPQNMSNNAAVTPQGGEIGRSQALQARACGIAPSVDMNPVLLKPQAGGGVQVVIRGAVATGGQPRPGPALLPLVRESFARVAAGADLVLVEGAGSPAEVNLRPGDIANMGFARAADIPAVLIADVDRGGAIASIVGTWSLLEAGDRAQLCGYVINKFRGDVRLFDGALATIEEKTGLHCFGIVPWFAGAAVLPAEDAAVLDAAPPEPDGAPTGAIRIAVPKLPGIANFDDLDPLRLEPDVTVEIIPPGHPLPADADLVLLPGSKSTLADLAVLRSQGWDIDILAHHRRGGRVLGLCGGYQMLGQSIADPDGLEGLAGTAPGLGLLDVETVLGGDKRVAIARGHDPVSGRTVTGYEIHMGETRGPDRVRAMVRLEPGGDEGARSPDGLVEGCYLHGLFADDGYRAAYLARLRPNRRAALRFEAEVEAALDALAAHLEDALDLDDLLAVARARSVS